jgi:hypothetical protein
MRWLLIAAALGLAAWASAPGPAGTPPAEAKPLGISPSAPAFVNGPAATVSFTVQDDLPDGSEVTITASPGSRGGFNSVEIFGPDGTCDSNPDVVINNSPTGVDEATVTADCIDNGLDTETVNINGHDGIVTFSCSQVGPVVIAVEQEDDDDDGMSEPISISTVVNCLEEQDQPVDIQLELQPEDVETCPDEILISAQVEDVNGDPLPDGTTVSFSVDGGTLVPGPSAQMFDGWARVTLQVEKDDEPLIRLLVSFGAITESERIHVDCSAGGAAATELVQFKFSSEPVECGKSAFLSANVFQEVADDPEENEPVDDGVTVLFLAENGTIEPAEATTKQGAVSVVYTAPSEGDEDTISVAVLDFFASTTVEIDCGGTDGEDAGGDGSGGGAGGADGVTNGSATGGVGGATGEISPPNTGSGGLRTAESDSRESFLLAVAAGAVLTALALRARSRAER